MKLFDLDEGALLLLVKLRRIGKRQHTTRGFPSKADTPMLRALKSANGNKAAAAKILGIAYSTLFQKMKKYRIIVPQG